MVYLATFVGRGSWVNSLIRFWTRSDASHSEIKIGPCGYSSSIMDGGVRCKRIDFNSSDWELLPLPWVEQSEVIQYFAKTQGNPYGWMDLILRQLLHLPSKNRKGQFCSEWCAESIGLKSGREFSPYLLRDIISDILDITENK